jgi:hypothetical protein
LRIANDFANTMCAVKDFIKDSMCSQEDSEIIDPYASAWALGDKLQSVGLQNYATDKTYTHYCNPFDFDKTRVITPAAIDKLLSTETFSPQLANIFVDCVASHFRNKDVVKGGVDEWDTVVQKHTKLRKVTLIAFSDHTKAEFCIKSKESYMAKKKEKPAPVLLSQQNGVVTPAKRTVNGTPVQQAATAGTSQSGGAVQPAQTGEPGKVMKQDEEAAPRSAASFWAQGHLPVNRKTLHHEAVRTPRMALQPSIRSTHEPCATLKLLS